MARVLPQTNQLQQFLNQYKAKPASPGEKKKFTHTWFGGNFTATYDIPAEKYSELYQLCYQQAFVTRKPVHLIERWTDPSILKIDLDFEFPTGSPGRVYTENNLKDFIQSYNKLLLEYTDVTPECLHAYVFERTKGYRDKGKLKDGVHIMYPEIVLSAKIQHFLRDKFLAKSIHVFDQMGLENRKYQDVFDKSIISSNGWMMYGSTKSAREPYLLTKIYDLQLESVSNERTPNQLIEYLSLYNTEHKQTFKMKPEKENQIANYATQRKPNQHQINRSIRAVSMGSTAYGDASSYPDFELVKKLVNCLSDYRAFDHGQWVEVGICLYNIHSSLLPVWIQFSKRVPDKFQPGVCEERWATFGRRGDERSLGIGSLHRWAMLDDPVNYEEVKRGSLETYIRQSMNKTTSSVAMVVYQMYKYQYVCSSIKHGTWWAFKNHRWIETEGGVELFSKLSEEVVSEYLKMKHSFIDQAQNSRGNDKHQHIDDMKKLLDVIIELQQYTFKEKVMKECKHKFYVEKFEDQLDSNPDLLCFENGVYNLNTREFRDGRPEDYCSISTGIEYREVDLKDNEEIQQIRLFLYQIFPIQEVREYALTLLASFLQGRNPDEKFHVWTGKGGNGKSKVIELFKKCFGGYARNLDVALLTQKRAAASSASPGLAKCRGVRFVDMAEPDRGERMNIGLMKHLTGGDTIEARQLYKNPFEFKPVFKIVLLCNDLPKVPHDDEGTWRRLRVVHFPSKFTDKPNPDPKKYEFPRDSKLSENFERWAEPFMYLLLDYYQQYLTNGLHEPEQVKQATTEYQKTSDMYADFVEDILEASSGDSIRQDLLFGTFRSWFKDNQSGKMGTAKEFYNQMEAKIGKRTGSIFKGYKIKMNGEFGQLNNLSLLDDPAEEEPTPERYEERPSSPDSSTSIDKIKISSPVTEDVPPKRKLQLGKTAIS